jgi:uncharacterized protein (DUF1330 family)
LNLRIDRNKSVAGGDAGERHSSGAGCGRVAKDIALPAASATHRLRKSRLRRQCVPFDFTAQRTMPAYIYANVEITDPVAYEAYRAEVPGMIAAHGGRYLVRGGATTLLEGPGVPQRQVILEFPDMAHLQAFYHSVDYRRLIAIRQSASVGTLFAIEGV